MKSINPNIEIKQKVKRRNVEYIGLIAFFSFFSFNFIIETGTFIFVILTLISVIAGFTLSSKRENRRCLNINNRYRIISNIVESLSFTLTIAVIGLIGYINKYPFILMQSYLTYLINGYYLGSFIGETYWRVKNYLNLREDLQNNYKQNLKSSIILPLSK